MPDLQPSGAAEYVGLTGSGTSVPVVLSADAGVLGHAGADSGRDPLINREGSVISAEGRARTVCSSRLDFLDMSMRGSLCNGLGRKTNSIALYKRQPNRFVTFDIYRRLNGQVKQQALLGTLSADSAHVLNNSADLVKDFLPPDKPTIASSFGDKKK